MFKIEAFDASLPCKELELNPDLFHHALREGDRRFHVRNPRGDSFDLVYYDNNDDLEPLESYPAYVKGPYMASYRIYDETDKDTLYLGFFDGLKSLEFEELNEYTIALTRVVLACTDMEVYCTDQRVCWFIPENERLHVVPVLPVLPGETTFNIQAQMEDCGRFCISVPKEELMEYAGKVSGSPMAVIAVLMAKAMEKVHPENTLPVKITSPVSVRRIMGNTHSLQHQVVHTSYQFSADELKAEGSHEKLIRDYRTHLKGFMTEQNIRMMCGVYSGIVQGMFKAQQYHMLDKVIMEQRENMGAGIAVSYLGILRTGEYGKRIRMTAFHAMQEKGIMLQAAEIGGTFYLCWYQGFRDDCYVRAMTEEMTALGMPGARFERA